MQQQRGILEGIVNPPTPLKPVTFPPANKWEKLLQKLKLKRPETVMLQLYSSYLNTNATVAMMLLDLQTDSDLPGDDKLLDLMQANTHQMAAIIAVAIHNDPSPVPERLVNVIAKQFTNEEAKVALKEVYGRLDMQSFLDCTGFLRDLSMLIDIPEIPASQPLSEIPNLPTN